MVKKSEERKDIHTEKKIGFKTCEDSYTTVSKMWEDSCLKLYKPWFESTEALFGKAFELSKDATPETYKEFYSNGSKRPRTASENFIRSTLESNKETFEILLVSTEESKKIYGSWIAELEGNSKALPSSYLIQP